MNKGQKKQIVKDLHQTGFHIDEFIKDYETSRYFKDWLLKMASDLGVKEEFADYIPVEPEELRGVPSMEELEVRKEKIKEVF